METFEWILLLLLAAAALAEFARRFGAPYPTMLALGGVAVGLIPSSPQWTLDPHLALTLFVAPVLLDAAYDTSLRDLRRQWKPVAGLVVAAVATTVLGVALVCRWLVPGTPWAVAICLGAIVAPPDAAAATAVMRQVGLPHRVLSVLEGESLLNDASALLIYRLALMAIITGPLSLSDYLPVFLLTVFGSIAAGIGLGFVVRPVVSAPKHVPTSLILQFVVTFGVWILAERIELSGILTMVAFAMTMARDGGPKIPASMRIPILAVWETVVFMLNALAFVLIGMQLRPIWERLGNGPARTESVTVAACVLVVVIATRFLWVMTYSAIAKRQGLRNPVGEHAKRTWGGSVVVSWAGMRGIVTLAAAFAVPETLPDGSAFPYRDLILLSAFSVVLGTLVIQGLTMKPIIRMLKLDEDDVVKDEVRLGRAQMYQVLIACLQDDDSLHAKLLRKKYQAIVDLNVGGDRSHPLNEVPSGPFIRSALAQARHKAIELRSLEIIGDQAFRVLVQELDWAELSAGGSEAE